MQAVILAAGLGSRIREYHDLPKGFIRVGSEPIILESIQRLKQQGISEILIVTGYRSECYEEIADADPTVFTVHNDAFNESGSLYSLYCARHWIKENFLLLESDLIYSQDALDQLCKDTHANTILLSGATHSGDEVYVQANDAQLLNMSKQIEALNEQSIYGEFVGINKLSLSAYRELMNIVEADSSLLQNGHYEEDGLVALTTVCPVYCLKVPNLLWCEIDNINHLMRARELYPRLIQEVEGTEYAA